MLYNIEKLHQTTTAFYEQSYCPLLYNIEKLHQTTTGSDKLLCHYRLYNIEKLHQTTTCLFGGLAPPRCIILKNYIKPQQACHSPYSRDVV